ncbi:MAG: hypothetical protein ACFFD4_20550, partial [Candidatus Odinarchaeota archaeon]
MDLKPNLNLTRHFKQSGIPLTPPFHTIVIELLLQFRVIQEMISNVRKHSQAACVIIQLHFGHDRVAATVSDDGKGF